MGRIFQRGQVWWIAYCHEGKEYRESSRSQKKTQATLLLRQRLSELHTDTTQQPSSRIVYVNELLDLVEQDYMLHKRRSRTNQSYLQRMRTVFGHLQVAECTKIRISEYQLTLQNAGITPEAINRQCRILRRAFTLGDDEGLIQRPPTIRHFAETTVRQGFFEAEELAALLCYLPRDIGDAARFAYLTGWRKGEIFGLEWANVDRRNRVIRLRPDQTKTHHSRVLAAEGDVWCLLEERWQARIAGNRLLPWVFHRRGKPIGDIHYLWRRACVQAGIPGKLFHDFRRTAARNMVRQGVPDHIIMSILGHKTRSIFDRYNIVTEADQRQALRTVFGQLSDRDAEHIAKSD